MTPLFPMTSCEVHWNRQNTCQRLRSCSILANLWNRPCQFRFCLIRPVEKEKDTLSAGQRFTRPLEATNSSIHVEPGTCTCRLVNIYQNIVVSLSYVFVCVLTPISSGAVDNFWWMWPHQTGSKRRTANTRGFLLILFKCSTFLFSLAFNFLVARGLQRALSLIDSEVKYCVLGT